MYTVNLYVAKERDGLKKPILRFVPHDEDPSCRRLVECETGVQLYHCFTVGLCYVLSYKEGRMTA